MNRMIVEYPGHPMTDTYYLFDHDGNYVASTSRGAWDHMVVAVRRSDKRWAEQRRASYEKHGVVLPEHEIILDE
jgi:hypothetical protein